MPRGLLARALRIAASAIRSPLVATIRLLRLLPRPIRRSVLLPIARVAARRADHPGSRWAPGIAFVAYHAAGADATARRLSEALGTARQVNPATRRRLAEIAIAAKEPALARRIADSLEADSTPSLLAVRARLELEAGRYAAALALAQRAASGGSAEAERLLQRIEGQLTVLTPRWLPDVGRAGARLRHQRGDGSAVSGRILHLVSVALPYRVAGYTVRTQDVAASQRGAGLDPHVATRALYQASAGRHGPPRHEQHGGVNYHHLAARYLPADRPDRDLDAAARALAELVANLRPAVLQPASNHLQAQTAIAVGRDAGIPVVYEVRGFWEDSWAAQQLDGPAASIETDHYRATRDTETTMMSAAAMVVTLSESMRAEIVERGIDPARVVVIPNAIDPERFRPRPRDARLAAALGIGPRDPVVGYVSTLTSFEAIPLLLSAVASLRRDVPGLRALIVGDGPEREAIIDAARTLNLDDGTLVLPGRVPHAEIARYYSLFDAFVVPRSDSRVARLVTPLKPFEAMAMGLAVVVADLPALREIVTNQSAGATFRAGDAGDLAVVLRTLLGDRALRERLGQQARAWVLEERTWDRNGQRYRELFERMGVA